MDKSTKLIIALIVIVLAVLGVIMLRNDDENDEDVANITSYQECVDAGYPIMESFPEQCAVPGGDTFVNDIEEPIDVDNISEPADNETEPENFEDTELVAVGNYEGNALATRSYTNGGFKYCEYFHTMSKCRGLNAQ